MWEELCVVPIALSEQKSNELAWWLGGRDSKEGEIQKIFLIGNHEYLRQFLCNDGTCYTKNTYSQPLKIMGGQIVNPHLMTVYCLSASVLFKQWNEFLTIEGLLNLEKKRKILWIWHRTDVFYWEACRSAIENRHLN